jgi:arabinose-5-phosphate isomerase
MRHSQQKVISIAKSVLQKEANSIQEASDKIGTDFFSVIQFIQRMKPENQILLSGVGKSAAVAKKISSTLNSIGIKAFFVHCTEALHGDWGVFRKGDLVIVISKSGSGSELIQFLTFLKTFQTKILAIVGNLNSPLAHQSDWVFDASVKEEADSLKIIPTSSTTVAMALGDALTVALIDVRNFKKSDFATFHPGGQLGKNLLLKVETLMHKNVAKVQPNTSARELIIAMTTHPLGGACVVDGKEHLLGLITDGDLRRALLNNDDFQKIKAKDLMTKKPTHISSEDLIEDALELMENRKSQISVLPVISKKTKKLSGLIRIHDIYHISKI